MSEGSAAPAAGNSGSKLMLVALAVGVLNVGGTGFIGMKLSSLAHTAAEQAAAKAGHDEHAGPGPTAPLDGFIVNLNEPDGQSRYLKTTLEMELANAEAVDLLAKSKAAVRDEFLRYLSGLKVSDTQGEEGKAKIQGELVARAKKVLGEGRVKGLYFNEFVIQ